MPVFAIKTDHREIVKCFIEDTNKRLDSKEITKNPFKGKIVRVKNYDCKLPDYYLVDLEPLYPPFYLGGLFAVMINIVFYRAWLLWAGIIVFSLGFFWSKWFFFIMLRLGLRKAGYPGPVNLVKDKDAIKTIMYKIL